MTAREYAKVAGQITDEQDAIREKLKTTRDSTTSAQLTGKIDGLSIALQILRAAVL